MGKETHGKGAAEVMAAKKAGTPAEKNSANNTTESIAVEDMPKKAKTLVGDASGKQKQKEVNGKGAKEAPAAKKVGTPAEKNSASGKEKQKEANGNGAKEVTAANKIVTPTLEANSANSSS